MPPMRFINLQVMMTLKWQINTIRKKVKSQYYIILILYTKITLVIILRGAGIPRVGASLMKVMYSTR